jgi:hypothetical protein
MNVLHFTELYTSKLFKKINCVYYTNFLLNQLAMCIWVYFWTLLLHWSTCLFFTWNHIYLWLLNLNSKFFWFFGFFCGTRVCTQGLLLLKAGTLTLFQSKSWTQISPPHFFLVLTFPYKFANYLAIFFLKLHWYSVEIVLNLEINWEEMTILIIWFQSIDMVYLLIDSGYHWLFSSVLLFSFLHTACILLD